MIEGKDGSTEGKNISTRTVALRVVRRGVPRAEAMRRRAV